MMRFVLALSVLAACGPMAPQASSTPTVAKGQKVKCKEVQMTGSMLSRSMCMTEEEETEIRETHQQTLRSKEIGNATKSN
ncbi:MAG: hypothetical protein K8W52_31750 [Deltaproteobacteria bacterium]|nr:hypothetical protein [Deltaproteobacteria bacterium]